MSEREGEAGRATAPRRRVRAVARESERLGIWCAESVWFFVGGGGTGSYLEDKNKQGVICKFYVETL